jgi:hypothetical protein
MAAATAARGPGNTKQAEPTEEERQALLKQMQLLGYMD